MALHDAPSRMYTSEAMPLKQPLSPRNRGLVILAGCTACVLLNLAVLRAWGQYYVFLFPFAFALAPVGLTLLVSGSSPREARNGGMTRDAARMMLALMVAGAVLGFVANRALSRLH